MASTKLLAPAGGGGGGGNAARIVVDGGLSAGGDADSMIMGQDGNPDDDENQQTEMGYQQTLMYGRYSKSLGDYAKEEAKRQKIVEKRRRKALEKRRRELEGKEGDKKHRRSALYTSIAAGVTYVWKHTFAKIGEDWVFLCVLGILMACISMVMDWGIELCSNSRLWLYHHLGKNLALQYFAWVTLPVFLVLFSAGFVHVVAPQAIGSGIPEMKTILRGVVLKEYLSGKTLLAKAVGLTATLGSGMPLGKEGPFVHIASIVATGLSKLVTSFQGIYANESRNSEMLAAACAVGVACCFGSPVGGVLFSIEVTSVYFAVRNYWRGFFAAVCGAMTFRLISVWYGDIDTIVAVFMTGFRMEFPYAITELLVFAAIGVFCGLGGALYVYLHRRYVLWMRGNKKLTKFLQKNRFIYPFLVSWIISTLSFPPFTGQFQAADISTHDQIHALFENYTWSRGDNYSSMSAEEWSHVKHWETPYTDIFANLVIYILMTFFLSILAATLPVPTGVLIPTFKVGAAFGRLTGEAMHKWFPAGLRFSPEVLKGLEPQHITYIAPGGYATVGAAAFSGAVTHTISISVIVFEMTGQITHCIPVLIAVLISNAIASLLQPSCYDSIIMIKKLPYLPDILPASSGAYSLFVDDFMLREIKYIWYGMTHSELRQVLKDGRKLRAFPLVDNPDQMVLLGSIQRTELIAAIEKHIGAERRRQVARQRYEEEIKRQREREMRRREEEVVQRKIRAQKMEEEEREAERKRKEEEEKAKKLEEEKKKQQLLSLESPTAAAPKQRRPSRFEVTTEGGSTFVPPAAEEEEEEDEEDKASAHSKTSTASPIGEKEKEESTLEERFGLSTPLPADSPAIRALQQLSSQPKKSILKKSNSHTIHALPSGMHNSPSSPAVGELARNMAKAIEESRRRKMEGRSATLDNNSSNYKTVTGAPINSPSDRWRSAFNNLFKRPSQLTLGGSNSNMGDGDSITSAAGPMLSQKRLDMTLTEQRAWEQSEMQRPVDFAHCHIDPAPFQLVEKTSLLKVHSLFSMLGVNHAYVTAIGRLIGVVGLKELRAAIEEANSGRGNANKEEALPVPVPASQPENSTQIEFNTDDEDDDESDYELMSKNGASKA